MNTESKYNFFGRGDLRAQDVGMGPWGISVDGHMMQKKRFLVMLFVLMGRLLTSFGAMESEGLEAWTHALAVASVQGYTGTDPMGSTEGSDLQKPLAVLLEKGVSATVGAIDFSSPSLVVEDRGGAVWTLTGRLPDARRMVTVSALQRASGWKPLSLTITGLDPQSGAGFEDARRLVMGLLLDGKTSGLALSAMTSLASTGRTRLTTWRGRELTAPWTAYWVFFSDDAPLANWAHPCRYIFVAADLSSVAVQYALTPLEVSPTDVNDADTGTTLETILPFVPPRETSSITPSEFREPVAINYTGAVSNCYAVILSGGCDLANNHIRYWGDAAHVYSTLTLKYGYPKTNIYALISDGLDPAPDRSDDSNSPFDLDGDGVADTLAAATAANVSNVFEALQSRLTTNDQLFVFFTDHGEPIPSAGDWDVQLNLWNSEVLPDAALKALTTNLPCPILFAMEQCYSGGFLNDLDQPNRVIATAAQYNESSYAGETFPGFDQWCYYWMAAMRGFFPVTNAPWLDAAPCHADYNGDGYVSFQEAYDFAYANKYAEDHPMYQETPAGLGRGLFLTKPTVDTLGMDRLAVDPLPVLQATNLPFGVRITAENAVGRVMTNFNGPAFLQAVAPPLDPGFYVGQQSLSWNYPLAAYYQDARAQVIYPSTMLGGAQTISNMALHVNTETSQRLNAFTIRLRHTALESYSASPEWEGTGWTTVYQSNLLITSTGWVSFVFTNAFVYNGADHLMADFSFNNTNYTSDGYCQAGTALVYRSIVYRSDSEDGDPLVWSGSSPSPNPSFYFPNIRLGPPMIPVHVAIQPTNLTGFVHGVWTGMVRVLNAVDDVRLLAMGTNVYWSGSSIPFTVKDYLFVLNSEQVNAGNGEVVLTWQSGTSGTYRVLASTGLVHGFSVLATNLPATPPLNSYTGVLDAANQRFFCVQEE
ncbi:MAG: hypothetical protein EOM20_15395 [Spartobacteria bacterium]|nr:hypothetical protein [Spartobacteria bacterium]